MRKRQVEPAVLGVRKHLDTLREGVTLLNDMHVELTEDTIDAIVRARFVADHQLAQLQAGGLLTEELEEAAESIIEQLRSRYPWKEIRGIEAPIERIREAYAEERRRRIKTQELRMQAVREDVMSIEGYAELGPDQAHSLMSVVNRAARETSDENVTPSLEELLAGLPERLAVARRDAEEKLVQLRDERSGEVFTPLHLRLGHREIRGARDVETLLEEIRERLMEALAQGQKVRLRLE